MLIVVFVHCVGSRESMQQFRLNSICRSQFDPTYPQNLRRWREPGANREQSTKIRRALASSPDSVTFAMRKGIAVSDLLAAPGVPVSAAVSAAATHKRAAAAARAGAGPATRTAVGAATATTSDGFRRVDRVGCELIED